jgi:N utilization substance protein B
MSQTLQATYAAKRKARRFAVQGIYEWQMSHNPVHEIEARTRVENAMHKVSRLLS